MHTSLAVNYASEQFRFDDLPALDKSLGTVVDLRTKRLPFLTAQQAFAGRAGVCDLSSNEHEFFVEFSRSNLDMIISVVQIGNEHPLRNSLVQRGDSVSTDFYYPLDEDVYDNSKEARAMHKKRSALLVHIIGQMRKRGAAISMTMTQQYHSMQVM